MRFIESDNHNTVITKAPPNGQKAARLDVASGVGVVLWMLREVRGRLAGERDFSVNFIWADGAHYAAFLNSSTLAATS